MTTHVFIVDEETFDIHLKYLFAGTGNFKYEDIINNDKHHTKESTIFSMIADASRIRKNDQIIFYLQGVNKKGVKKEGGFYGIFKAKDCSFLDKKKYLVELLEGKPLPLRTLIIPDKVYAKRVKEWDALENLKNISPQRKMLSREMLWSLIYRKLRGKRGNTMLTIYEADRLCKLIEEKNNKKVLENDGQLFFDKTCLEIKRNTNKNEYIDEKQSEIDILGILPEERLKKNNLLEAHLQAYIVKNIGRKTNNSLDDSLLENSEIEWLGNEIYCGLGMEKIDIALSIVECSTKQPTLILIELKKDEIYLNEHICEQICHYKRWIKQYYIPNNREKKIQSVIIAKKPSDSKLNRSKPRYEKMVSSFKQKQIKYIEYEIIKNNNNFEFFFEKK